MSTQVQMGKCCWVAFGPMSIWSAFDRRTDIGTLLKTRRWPDVRCRHVHRLAVAPLSGLIGIWSTFSLQPDVDPMSPWQSDRSRADVRFDRHLVGKSTSADCRHYTPARWRVDLGVDRHFVGMPSSSPPSSHPADILQSVRRRLPPSGRWLCHSLPWSGQHRADVGMLAGTFIYRSIAVQRGECSLDKFARPLRGGGGGGGRRWGGRLLICICTQKKRQKCSREWLVKQKTGCVKAS